MGADPYAAFLAKQAIVITVFWAVILYLSFRPDFEYEEQIKVYGLLIFLFSAGTFFVIEIFGYIICIVIDIGFVCYLFNYRSRIEAASWNQTGSYSYRPFSPVKSSYIPVNQVKHSNQNYPSQNQRHRNVLHRSFRVENMVFKGLKSLDIGLDIVRNSRFKAFPGWNYFGIYVSPDLDRPSCKQKLQTKTAIPRSVF